MHVTRGDLCGTVVTAGFQREIGGLAIVTRVSSSARVVCTGEYRVVDYQGTIFSLATGKYRVRLFEAVEDGEPQQLSTGIVTVVPPTFVPLDARNR
jgi:ABC-type microcin C transport system duplicated ATPase subunit YejF